MSYLQTATTRTTPEKPRFRWVNKCGDVWGWVAINMEAIDYVMKLKYGQ